MKIHPSASACQDNDEKESVTVLRRREKMLDLQETLLNLEQERHNGARYYSVDELDEQFEAAISIFVR